MKIESSFQSQHSLSHQGESDADRKLMRQAWLKEMEKAHGGMIKNMQSVSSRDMPLENNQSRNFDKEEMHHESESSLKNELLNISDSNRTLSSYANHLSSLNQSSPSQVNFKTNTLLNNLIANVKNDFNIREGLKQNGNTNEQLSTVHKVLPENSYEVWNKKNIHLANTNEGLALWLRDVEIDQDNERQICQEIQRRLSELGIHLSKIYLNGRLISTSTTAEPII